MTTAQTLKNDEFYTQYKDIEAEVFRYPPSCWSGKTVFCNCNDGFSSAMGDGSAFLRFFRGRFHQLGLKGLICLTYFSEPGGGRIWRYDGEQWTEQSLPGYHGGYSELPSVEILCGEADVVVTNPPFSSCNAFWHLVINSGKSFLFIANHLSVTYSSLERYFVQKLVWPGYKRVEFFITKHGSVSRVPAFWFTNLPIEDRPARRKKLHFVPLAEIPEDCKYVNDDGFPGFLAGYVPSDYSGPFFVMGEYITRGLFDRDYERLGTTHKSQLGGKTQFIRVMAQRYSSLVEEISDKVDHLPDVSSVSGGREGKVL